MTKAHSPWLSTDFWLSEALGKAAFRLSPDVGLLSNQSGQSIEAEKSLHTLAGENSFIYAKTPVADLAGVAWLQDRGFRLVETNLQFARSIRPFDGQSSHAIGFAEPVEEEAVANIAGVSFLSSRFHVDREIGIDKANELKAAWARNFFKGLRGHAMIVSRKDATVGGFLLLLKNSTGLTIDLIATDERYRGQGLGREMISFAIKSFPEAERIVVGTQAENHRSVTFYENLGFRFQSASYTFHRHGYSTT